MTVIIGAYHKTGSVLFDKIWQNYKRLDRTFRFRSVNHFWCVKDDDINANKCIVIIRHPYEIIMSSMRYHQTGKEAWSNKNVKRLNNESYTMYLRHLNTADDKISFELKECANGSFWNRHPLFSNTIDAIYNDIKNRNSTNNVLFIKLELLWTQEGIEEICEKIKQHLRDVHDIKLPELIASFNNQLSVNHHRTYNNNNYTFTTSFNRIHYEQIRERYPEDLLEVFGYDVKSDDLCEQTRSVCDVVE